MPEMALPATFHKLDVHNRSESQFPLHRFFAKRTAIFLSGRGHTRARGVRALPGFDGHKFLLTRMLTKQLIQMRRNEIGLNDESNSNLGYGLRVISRNPM